VSAGARPLRVLLHKPLRRVSEPYFRVRQYVAALERLGHRPELLDFGRLRGSAARRLFGVLGQLAVSARAFTRHDVIVLTPHPLVALYVLLARLLGRRVILDQILTYISHREVLRWFPRWLDTWTYRMADGILTHSETMRRELTAEFGLDPARIEVVYPVLDLALFSRRYDAEADALRRSLGIKDRFVVLYHGMWHPWHGLSYIYEAARLLESHPEIVFVVIPKDGEPNRKNLLFVEEQPFERLPVYLQMADAWCSGFDSDARGERAFSSTLIQSLALGLPVVTGSTGERATVLRDGVTARLVPLRDPRAVADAVLELARGPDAARAMGARARAFAEAHFSLGLLDQALAALLARIALSGSRDLRHTSP
jgi:glycosyltransferase involved in cell wall biosynthesis